LTNPGKYVILISEKEKETETMIDMEKREALLERVIRVYGFEHEITIGFAKLCENELFSDACLEALCIAHECFPYHGE
jgi:hypothetical protein